MKHNNKINLIIAEDHALYLKALDNIMKSQENINLVTTAINGVDLLEKLEIYSADLILLDIRMPKMDGIEAAKIIKEKYPKIKIIMLTMHNHASMIKQMLQMGIHGYILKNTDIAEMINAFSIVMDGGTYYGDEVKDSIIEDAVKNTMDNKVVLSTNEKNILNLVCAGNSDKQISKQMKMDIATIVTYINNINAKTSTHNRKALIRFAYENNLTTY